MQGRPFPRIHSVEPPPSLHRAGTSAGDPHPAHHARFHTHAEGPITAVACCLLLVLTFIALPLAGPAFADEDALTAAVAALDEDQQRELEHLLEDLRDENLSLDRRRRAAQILLTRDWEAATEALKLDLVRNSEIGTQRAVAQAVAAVDLPDPDLMQPLMDLLDTEQTDLRRDVAAALGRFDDEQTVQRLMTIAEEGGASEAERLGAIEALAQHRRAEVVELLLSLTDREAWDVQTTAFDALARLSGLHALEEDAEAWRQWWQRAQSLSESQWQASLLQNFSNRNAAIGKQLEVTTERLVSAHNRLYDATAEANRPAMLRQMLDDSMEELRRLALQLIERRVLNAQPVGDEVREAMRQRLADGSADVRIKSASVLETLADAEAAERATELLLAERDSTVQAAYLALIARVPSERAVEPALWLLQRGRVAPAAAKCLTAAYDADLMSDRQAARALRVVRTYFADAEAERDDESDAEASNAEPQDPAPPEAHAPMLTLLSRIGEREDQPVLAAYLTHSDRTVRLTAARGFAQEQWSLDPLLDVLGNPELAAAAFTVIAERGEQLATAERLIEHEPDAENAEDLHTAWTDALAAVAGRLDADATAQLDAALQSAERPTVRERVLRAAAALDGAEWADNLSAGRAEAALRLCRVYLDNERLDDAGAVYQRLADRVKALSEEQRRRLAIGRTEQMLADGGVDEAAEMNATVLDEQAISADELAAVWIHIAERSIANGSDRARLRSIVETAETLFEPHATEDILTRLGELREQLDKLAAR